jgi:hypothetical protein
MQVLVVICAVAALSVAGSADGARSSCKLIVPGKSLACVSIGMTQAQVRSVAGKPRATTKVAGCCGRILTFVYPQFTVSFLGPKFRKVSWVTSMSRLYRTATGVGVGSTKAQLLAGIKGIRCGVFGLAKTFCIAGKALNDPKQTFFGLGTGRVDWVRLGFQPE